LAFHVNVIDDVLNDPVDSPVGTAGAVVSDMRLMISTATFSPSNPLSPVSGPAKVVTTLGQM